MTLHDTLSQRVSIAGFAIPVIALVGVAAFFLLRKRRPKSITQVF